jgi:hypothetical protein
LASKVKGARSSGGALLRRLPFAPKGNQGRPSGQLDLPFRSLDSPAFLGDVEAEHQRGTRVHASKASWDESASKQAIIDFVGRVTQKGGSNYVGPAERIAVSDNDGTLVRQPVQTPVNHWTWNVEGSIPLK